MRVFEQPLPELRRHVTEAVEPSDLDAFWAKTLADHEGIGVAPVFEPANTPLTVMRTYDVTFSGCDGQPVRGWLHVPRGEPGPLPCVVEIVGYGGGRGLAHRHVFWATAGFAHFVMDTRGQGSSWSSGDTPDPNDGAPAHPGFLTRGILDPGDYYYRRVFVDAVRAVDAARAHPDVDATTIAVAGASQGGGVSIAVAALRNDVAAVIPEVPFLADIRHATEITDSDPYAEVARYLRAHRDQVETVFRTLAYFDVALLGRRATAPALFSVALMDAVCPPSTVYAAYNSYGGQKAILEYPYNDHEGGGEFHDVAKVDWLRKVIAR